MLKKIKEKLLSENFIVNEPLENVIVIENYLMEEELNWFNNLLNNTSEEEWFKEYMSNLKPFCLEKFGRDDVENLVKEGLFEITQNWEDKNLNFSNNQISNTITERINNYIRQIEPGLACNGLGSIQRMQKDVELKCHTDQDTDPSIEYATIIYLNDNYSKGELFFKHKNFEIKPKKGSLLIFPGSEEFHHGVRPVGDGPIRYVVVGFVKKNNYYKFDRKGNVVNESK